MHDNLIIATAWCCTSCTDHELAACSREVTNRLTRANLIYCQKMYSGIQNEPCSAEDYYYNNYYALTLYALMTCFDVNWPAEIHFHSKLVPSDQLPVQDELAEWLKTCWDNKEKMLSEFYKNKSFPGPNLRDSKTIWYKMAATILFWFVLVVVILYGMVAVSYVWLYVIMVIAMHVIVDRLYGGWDSIILCAHDRKKNS